MPKGGAKTGIKGVTGAGPGYGKQGKLPKHELPKNSGSSMHGKAPHGKQGSPHTGHPGGMGENHSGGY